MKTARFKSDFAILDVKAGRQQLARNIERGEKIKVQIIMVLDNQSGRDDGISIEFSGEVMSVKEYAP